VVVVVVVVEVVEVVVVVVVEVVVLVVVVLVVVVVVVVAVVVMILLNGHGSQGVFIESRQTRSCSSSVGADVDLFLPTGHVRLTVYPWPLHNHL
jgi:hypothetical protein